MNAYAIAIAIAVLVYVVIGNYAGRKVKHLDDYFVAGRRAPTFLIVGTLVASVVGTNTFLGEVGFTYSGYAAAHILSTAVALLGYIVGALFFGRYIRRARAATVAEFFGNRFQSRRVRVFAAFTVILGIGGYLMTVTQGAALIVTWVTDISYTTALIAVWSGYTAFTIYSGSRGVVITDTLMFLLFATVGITAVYFISDSAGGWVHGISQLANFEPRPGIIGADGYTGPGGSWSSTADMWTWAAIMAVAWAIVFGISPWQSSRYLMARDEHVVVRSACITICVMTVLWPTVYISGPLIALLNPSIEPNNTAMIWAANNAMPTLVGAILLAGIVSAGLSSASTFMTLIGFAISNDVIDDPAASESSRLRVSRITMLAVGLVTLALAMVVPPDIFWITFMVATMFAASWGPVAFMSVWSKKITEAGAFWGLVTGFIGYVIPKALLLLNIISLPAWLDPLLLGFVISLVTVIAVSSATTVTAEENDYRESLHVPPPELTDAKAARLTMIWPRFMMLLGTVLSVLLVIFYARPYQLATGAVTGSWPFVVWTWELFLAIAFGGVIVCGGLFAQWAMRRFYA
ncbi:MAG: sodium:solute symporter family protein [Woeseiaceae bacterium]|jgi:sodium/pantothenate symporter